MPADTPDVRAFLEILAAHSVLPPPEALPPNDEAFRSLLAELARGEASSHASILQTVAVARLVPVEELTRRVQFVLACLVLPTSGDHYEVLGLSRDASAQEIRKRWAALMQRYHPDHLGGAGWLDGQARRLIEAYQTLRDPRHRREYDAQLAAGAGRSPMPPSMRPPVRRPARVLSWRARWAPLGILAVGVGVAVWMYVRPAPAPLPQMPLPSAPKLLEPPGGRQREVRRAAPAPPRGRFADEAASAPAPAPSRVTELPSLTARPSGPIPVAPASPKEPASPIPQAPAPSVAPPAPAPSAVTSASDTSAPANAGSLAAAPPPAAPPTAGVAAVAAPRSSVTPPPAVPAPTTSPTSAPAALPSRVAPGPAEPAAATPAPSSPAASASSPVLAPRPDFAAPPAPLSAPAGSQLVTAATAATPAVPVPPPPAAAAASAAVRSSGPVASPASAPVRAAAPPTPPAEGVAVAPRPVPPVASASPSSASPSASVAARPSGRPEPAVPTRPAPPSPAAVGARSSPPPQTAVAVASTPPVPSAADILALLEAFRVAYERKDLRALMGLFGAQPVEGETAGRPAVERLYTRNFAVLDGIRYELTDVEIGPAGDGQFVARGRFRIRAARPGDSTQTFDARGGVRWRVHRESGDLRIAGIDYVVDP